MSSSLRQGFLWLTLAAVLASAACSSVNESDLIGKWDVSAQVSSSQAGKLSDEPLPDGLEMEIMISGQQSFQQGGRYDENVELQVRLRLGDQQVPLAFQLRDAGTWELQGSTLMRIAEDVSVTALDTMTEDAAEAMPGLIDTLAPRKGTAVSMEILQLSAEQAEMLEQKSGITYMLQKN